jgi:hypothetical protein
MQKYPNIPQNKPLKKWEDDLNNDEVKHAIQVVDIEL